MIRWFRRRYWQWKFNRLDPIARQLIEFVGVAPHQLIKRGLL